MEDFLILQAYQVSSPQHPQKMGLFQENMFWIWMIFKGLPVMLR